MRNKSNERLEGGRIHVRNISSDEKYPPSMEGGCKRSVANDREKKRERKRDRERFQDERKVDEPPTRIPFATLHGLPR